MDTERYQGCVGTEERTCEDTARQWPLASQGARPQKPDLLTP